MVQTTDLGDSDDFPDLGRLYRSRLRSLKLAAAKLGTHLTELAKPKLVPLRTGTN